MLQVFYTQTPASTQEVILIPQGSAQPGIQPGGFQSTAAQQYVLQAPRGMAVAAPAYTTVQPEGTQSHSQQAGYNSVCVCVCVCVCACVCIGVWVWVCVFAHDNSSCYPRNKKFKYILVHKNSSDKFR